MKLLHRISSVAPEPRPVSNSPWRMIAGFGLSGALNMALDEALLESVVAGSDPVIRLYTWEPATLSLGVNQPVGEVETRECARRGFGLVRRLTGGRAVLHQHELTYSVIVRENEPRVSGGVVESYRKISEALIDGLRSLGAEASLAPPDRALHRALMLARRNPEGEGLAEGSHGAVCFDAASDYELTAGGRKLVGSAQARRGGALLQHGSILLDVDWDAWTSVFAYRTEAGRLRAAEKLPRRMTSLREQLGRQVNAEEAAEAVAAGFERAFQIALEPNAPTEAESARAARLVVEKYGSEAWTRRR
jgi:lipoate-protein ligase A